MGTLQRMEQHLREAHLRDDPDTADFWASAMKCWEQPIPDYARSELNQFSLGERAGATISESARDQRIGGSIFGSESQASRGPFKR